MSDEHRHFTGDEELPSDLRAMGSMLDALGAAERSAAPARLERSVLSAALGAAGAAAAEAVIESGAKLDGLAEAERSAANGSLEDRIFMATRMLVARAASEPAVGAEGTRMHRPALRLAATEEAEGRAGRSRRVSWRFALRAAAMIALAAVVVIGGRAMLPGSGPSNSERVVSSGVSAETAMLVRSVDHRLDQLLSDMDDHFAPDSGAFGALTLDDLINAGDLLSEDSL